MTDYKKQLKIKSDFLQAARAFLIKKEFIEIQTPKISFMPTDQDNHLFKTEYFGKEAYLIQSPQFYKQAYVINGVDAVFEIAPVFRAEPRVTERHLSEFTSLDVESSRFKKLEDILDFESKLIESATKALSRKHDIKPIETFEIVSYCDVKKALGLDQSTNLSNKHEAEISKHFKSDGVFIISYPSKERVFYYETINETSLSYDLIVDGLEITSGGIRTASKERLIKKMRAENIDPARYGPYLELFNGKVPIHGGFAIGIERIISKYLQIPDIANVSPHNKKPDTTGDNLVWN